MNVLYSSMEGDTNQTNSCYTGIDISGKLFVVQNLKGTRDILMTANQPNARGE